MPPKNDAKTRKITTRAHTAQTEGSDAGGEQVTVNMEGKDANKDLPSLIRTIFREEIGVVLDKLQPQLNALKEDVSECASKIVHVEEALCNMDIRLEQLEKLNGVLREDNEQLKQKAEKLEKYSRRSNVRVFGLTTGVERGNPTSYMAELLLEMFKDKLSVTHIGVEVAHRVGPVPKTGSRSMIVRLQDYMVKEDIVNNAKKEGVMEVRGMKLRIFPDLTEEMAKRRGSFKEIREKLWNAKVKQGIIYPATLIITFREEAKRFTDHIKAEAYWKDVIEPGLENEHAGS